MRCAWFEFGDLCDKALGAGDYLIIAETFSTVFINNIPQLTLQERDQASNSDFSFVAFIETPLPFRAFRYHNSQPPVSTCLVTCIVLLLRSARHSYRDTAEGTSCRSGASSPASTPSTRRR